MWSPTLGLPGRRTQAAFSRCSWGREGACFSPDWSSAATVGKKYRDRREWCMFFEGGGCRKQIHERQKKLQSVPFIIQWFNSFFFLFLHRASSVCSGEINRPKVCQTESRVTTMPEADDKGEVVLPAAAEGVKVAIDTEADTLAVLAFRHSFMKM